MRNLEQQIADWRRTMAKASDHRRELLDELEEHLREDIDKLTRSGISENEVFQIALSKLGAPPTVAAEYDKLTRKGKVWWPVKVAWGCVITGMLLMGAMIWRRPEILLVTHVVSVGIGYIAMFAIGGLGICYICAQWVGGPGPTQRHSLFRSTLHFANIAAILTPIAVVLGMIWAKEHWGRYWAWDPKETGGFFVILSAFLVSALQWFKASQMIVVFFGILGSMVTACAWFGTLGNSLSLNPLLIAFLVSHLLFLFSVPAVHLLKQRHTART